MRKSLETDTYNSIDPIEYHDYRNRVHEKFPKVCIDRMDYAKKIMPGQIYMQYIINELQDATMASAYSYGNKRIDKITFSTDDIETLLRAMGFMCSLMHNGLPEHNYNYIKSKSDSFFRELFYNVEENIDYYIDKK